MSGSFSLLWEFLTHPVFVGSACIVLVGVLLSVLFGIILDNSVSEIAECIGTFGLFISVVGSVVTLIAFLIWGTGV